MNFTHKLLGLSFAVLVGFAFTLRADDTPVAGKKSLESRIAELEAKLKDAGVGGAKAGVKISGYVDTSYLINLADRTESGPPAGSDNQNTGRVFDNQFDAFNLNAVKLTIEKAKDSSKYPAGFRVDTILGEDATTLKRAKAAGASTFDSDLYLEQAYINLGIPVENGIDIKFGKMVSLIGYEVIESPANAQFSRSDAFRLSPWVQTGITAGYQWNDHVTTTIGLINGIDSLTGVAGTSGGINYNTDVSFVGRVDVTLPKYSAGEFSGYVSGLYGNDETNVMASQLNRPNTYIWNLGVVWDKPFETKRLALGIDYLYRYSEIAIAAWAAGVQNVLQGVTAGSLSGYAKWDWNKHTTSSARFSWSDYGNVGGGPGNRAGATLSPLVLFTGAGASRTAQEDLYSITLTQAFNIWKDTLVRLEWRRDWTHNSVAGFGIANAVSHDDIRHEQDTIGVNVVYSF